MDEAADPRDASGGRRATGSHTLCVQDRAATPHALCAESGTIFFFLPREARNLDFINIPQIYKVGCYFKNSLKAMEAK